MQLFRKTSLEKLESPEQLDHLLTVTSPRSWMALAGAMILVLAAGIWSVAGTLPVKVYGSGILISAGGVHRVVSDVSGQVTDVSVQAGDSIESGRVVVRVSQPELLAEIRDVEAQIERSPEDEAALQVLRSRLERLRSELAMRTGVETLYSGRVIEVDVEPGDYIAAGSPLLTLEEQGSQLRELVGIAYVSPEDGEKIRVGMDAKIQPVSVLREEFGYILGRVTAVADFPSSFESMVKALGNEDLARSLARDGAPVQVTISLVPDPTTVSGYKWTTPAGPPVQIGSGTLSNAVITVAEYRPIGMIFPQWR